ncbi:MAG: alpha-ketoacid dehydrogenase subunit beta [Desulfobacterales bacterium]
MATMNMAQAINSALMNEMERDENVFMIGVDLKSGVMGVTAGLQKKFGDRRIIDTPITESAVVGAAVGAAAVGLRPVAELMFVDFIGVCFDQLFNQAAKMRYMFGGKARIPMVLRTCFGAGMGAAAQHSQSLEAWFMHVPGLKVVMPSTPYDAKGLLISAIRDDNPVVVMEHKGLYFMPGAVDVPEQAYTLPLGKADIKRQGSDVTVVATGLMVHTALGAAEALSQEGIELEIIDPMTLSPLDEATIIDSVKKTGRLIVMHEEVKFAGSGAEIAAMAAEKCFDDLDAPILRIGAPFTPVPFAAGLEGKFIPSAEQLIDAAKKIMGKNA